MKFDYQFGNLGVPASNVVFDKKPEANLFSCMDNPNYERGFEMAPKIMRKG